MNNNYDENYSNVPQNVAEELTERQQLIIKIIKNVAQNVAVNDKINTQYLAEKLGVNRKTIQIDLAELIDKNIIKWVGSNKTGYWKITKQ